MNVLINYKLCYGSSHLIIPAQHQGKAIGKMSSGTAYGVFINGLAIPIILLEYGWRFVWLFVFVIFGLSFNAIFGLVPAFVSLNFSKSLSTLIFGIATVLLGLGSMLGNLWGGMIHDYSQSFLPIYQISTITAFVLALLALGRRTILGNL